jgi:hypothetical protein
MKGKKTGGRRPGSVNKTTASTKAALTQAFDEMGGVQALVAWGRREPGAFYKLWGRMVPHEMTGPEGTPLMPPAVIILPPEE